MLYEYKKDEINRLEKCYLNYYIIVFLNLTLLFTAVQNGCMLSHLIAFLPGDPERSIKGEDTVMWLGNWFKIWYISDMWLMLIFITFSYFCMNLIAKPNVKCEKRSKFGDITGIYADIDI